ncbi:unnamed protein product [Rhodiola kirilowii]
MNLSNPYFILLLILNPLLQTLSSPAASSSSTKGFEIEQKTRLGSTPPSCHSKCNGCHPCFAVQVPTLPSHDRLDPSLDRVDHASVTDFYDLPGNRYSNYKPLGWKCRCNNHFYNP